MALLNKLYAEKKKTEKKKDAIFVFKFTKFCCKKENLTISHFVLKSNLFVMLSHISQINHINNIKLDFEAKLHIL